MLNGFQFLLHSNPLTRRSCFFLSSSLSLVHEFFRRRARHLNNCRSWLIILHTKMVLQSTVHHVSCAFFGQFDHWGRIRIWLLESTNSVFHYLEWSTEKNAGKWILSTNLRDSTNFEATNASDILYGHCHLSVLWFGHHCLEIPYKGFYCLVFYDYY